VKGLATLCLSEVIVAEREEQVALRSAGSEHDAPELRRTKQEVSELVSEFEDPDQVTKTIRARSGLGRAKECLGF
jgi:hypothetical protein